MKSRLVILVLFALLIGLIWSKRAARVTETTSATEVSIVDNRAPAAEAEAVNELDPAAEEPAQKEAAPKATLTPNPMTGEVSAQKPASSAKTVEEQIPSQESVRKEVAKNPHLTPPALTEFSIALSDKMEAAEKSEPKAKEFFSELEKCTLDPAQQGRNSIQALCLLNAKRLARTFPSMSRDYEALERRSDPRTIEMIRDL